MKWLQRFFASRFFLSLVGTVALALLVWFVGPLIGFSGAEPLASALHRWILIGGLFSVWGLTQIGAAVWARIRNRQLMEQLAAGPEPAADPAKLASEDELRALRERFDQALATLKESGGKQKLGGRWVYQLPWYLIIGPPGCGKTTALLHSGLRFPLAERLGQDAIHGIGGTRHCDWWFTDEAVLIDTAGRYTTQDSYEEVDRAAWQNFLALLKKHRPRRPINGVLVAVSLSDLMQLSQAERDAHALAIRQRVQELCQSFGIAVPVYVLFMKADLVAGFSEFFADLTKEGREQVWGMTFQSAPREDSPAPLTAFPEEMKALHARLDQRLLTRLEQEREPGKRTLLFSFPSQFGALGETLERFLNDAFAPSRFEIQPLVRGVYFTSGTQTGTPIDRILGAYAANFGLGRQGLLPFKGTGKSYFLNRLLREVIFQESGLAGLDPRLERRRLWLRRGAYAGAALVFLIAATAWATSYARNRAYIEDVAQRVVDIEARIDALTPEERDPLDALPLLDAARAIPRGFAERDRRVPLSMGLGLYQGEKLGSQSELAYRRILNKVLLPRVILRLEEQIRQSAAGNPDALYEALRVYLMLDSETHYDPTAVKRWVERDWQDSLPRETTTEQHAALRDHLDALMERRPVPLPLELDRSLIDQARGILNRSPLPERVYDRLTREGLGNAIRDFTVSDAAGEYANLVFVRRSGRPLNQGVPALYTYDGYHRGFTAASSRLIAEAAAESWVLGPDARLKSGTGDVRQLLDAIRDLYLRDYANVWKDLLDDLELIAVRDLRHAAQVMDILADPTQSPLRRLLTAAARQTELDRKPEPTEAAVPTPSSPDAVRRRVEGYLGDPSPNTTPGGSPESYVTNRFTWLHDLVNPDAQGRAPIDQLQTTLSKLELHLTGVAAAMASGRDLLVAGETAEIQDTKALAGKLPAPLGEWIGTLAQDSANLEAGGMRAQINSLWTSEILPFCREAINDRYPFVQGSARETTLFDFGRLLGPEGMIDTFFKKNLAPIVNTSRPTWRWVDASLGIPNEVLAQFQRAAVIREAFFMGGGKTPAVEFELQPTSMDARATQFILDLGGQIVDYRQGPPRSQRLKWPAPDGPARVRLTFMDATGSGPSLTEEGPWAWFRILDKSSLKPTNQPEKFQVAFSLGGLSARFELRAVSVRNPFHLQEVRQFRCPERL
ncbi:type VI secretion system membrane subunit TssM [Thiocystis violascens]|uniref:Type VI secretion protein IcmF n=1 Tax=Thiocystis violascens (strain ATCC 17096 / DSM 198 / 6111) TaxID=765911 RepID=I3YB81_THIV6|nr:type VI secretion system membrane subunit TssM [Thiocystis violascens]AFL74249.1 type VI secretion protein IcmF [Thiocystis violascens DSM 198]